ncbi:MAG: ASKHA domain-containing protein [Pseudomonadota bacterium]
MDKKGKPVVPRVTFQSDTVPIDLKPGETLMGAARLRSYAGKSSIEAPCGGKGRCGQCRVRVLDGRTNSPTASEKRLLSPEALSGGMRLACQCVPETAVTVDIPPESRTGTMDLRIMDCEIEIPAGHPTGPLGLAVDLGTTKVAGFLVNLETGGLLAAEGVMNPQIRFGADIITRLTHAMESPKQARALSRLLLDCIGHLADVLTHRVGLSSGCREIASVTVAANTAMHHLLLNWPVSQLCRAPYVPADTAPVEIPTRDLGLSFAKGARLYLIPPIAGFVGGDHTAMILACGLHEADGIHLGLDIGTNTELVLSHGGALFSCSCASGPAFEGAHLRQGVRAISGAVHKVELKEGGKILLNTIDERPPVGFCGSGVVDAVSELVKHRIVNSFGMLDRDHPRVRVSPNRGEPEFVFARVEECHSSRDLVLTQGDICAVQLAKAAVATGILALLGAAGIDYRKIEKVMVSGAFGTHLRIESAVTLGLLPALPAERFIQVGNAAGKGARMVLSSFTQKQKAEKLARTVTYLELAALPHFGRSYSRALKFTPPGSPGDFFSSASEMESKDES